MPTEYEMVVAPDTLIASLIPVLIHTFFVVVQLFLVGFFWIHGLTLLLAPSGESRRVDRFGSLRRLEERSPAVTRGIGVAQLIVGDLLLAPLVLAWPWSVSALACLLGAGLLIHFGRAATPVGRPMRRLAALATLLTLAFAFWEQADPSAQAIRILAKSNDWRAHELEWQLENDLRSPKVGDLAPDFELQDPSGERSVRLSDFKGKRPVALVFGSYT